MGDLIRAALDLGAQRLLIGLGGSATNDAGAGMLRALGARFLDADGTPLARGGAALGELDRVDLSGLDPRLVALDVQVACDVDNPLTGPGGASAVFGPQKGADGEAVSELDAALTRWADVVETTLPVRARPGVSEPPSSPSSRPVSIPGRPSSWRPPGYAGSSPAPTCV